MPKKKKQSKKEPKEEPEQEDSEEESELEQEVEEIEQAIDTTNFQQFMRPTQRIVSSLEKIQTISEPIQLEEQISSTPTPESEEIPRDYAEMAEKYETGGKYDVENPGLEPANLGRTQSQTPLLSPESRAEFITQNQSPDMLSNIKVQQQESRLPFEQEEQKYKKPGM